MSDKKIKKLKRRIKWLKRVRNAAIDNWNQQAIETIAWENTAQRLADNYKWAVFEREYQIERSNAE